MTSGDHTSGKATPKRSSAKKDSASPSDGDFSPRLSSASTQRLSRTSRLAMSKQKLSPSAQLRLLLARRDEPTLRLMSDFLKEMRETLLAKPTPAPARDGPADKLEVTDGATASPGGVFYYLRRMLSNRLQSGTSLSVSLAGSGMSPEVFEHPVLWMEFFHKRGITPLDLMPGSSFSKSFREALETQYPELVDEHSDFVRDAFQHVRELFGIYYMIKGAGLLDTHDGVRMLRGIGLIKLRAAIDYVARHLYAHVAAQEGIASEHYQRAQLAATLGTHGHIGQTISASVHNARTPVFASTTTQPAAAAPASKPGQGRRARAKAAQAKANAGKATANPDGRNNKNGGNK